MCTDLSDVTSLFVGVVSCPANSSELFPDCLKVMVFALVLRHRGSDRIYDMRCLFVTFLTSLV